MTKVNLKMTREDLQLMLELKEKFEKRANEVADILSGLKYLDEFDIKWDIINTYNNLWGDIEYIGDANDFWPDENRVKWLDGAGYSGSFPIDYLFESDENLRKFVDRVNLKNQKKIDKMQKQQEIAERKRERLLYEQLKAKFENESKN